MSGGGGQSTTTQKADPWSGQQPFLSFGFDQAKNNYLNKQPQYYQGDTVAPLSGTTQQAMGLQTQRALSGNPLQGAANNTLGNTISGGYLNSNPYLDANFNAGAQGIKNNYYEAVRGIGGNMAGAGRYGSGMQAFMTDQANNTLANNLGNLYTQTYFNNYNNERGNQMQAINQAMPYINQDYTDLSKLSDVGAAKDSYAQSKVDADVNRWNFMQNAPNNALSQYMGLIQGNYGGSTSTMTPTSGFGNMLGLGALGLAGYKALS